MKEKITKIQQKIKDLLTKFYSNKKIFWPIAISLSVVFLILILGILFGKRTPQTTSPQTEETPQPEIQNEIQEENENPLKILRNKINNLDVKQSRLKPPVVNFNVTF